MVKTIVTQIGLDIVDKFLKKPIEKTINRHISLRKLPSFTLPPTSILYQPDIVITDKFLEVEMYNNCGVPVVFATYMDQKDPATNGIKALDIISFYKGIVPEEKIDIIARLAVNYNKYNTFSKEYNFCFADLTNNEKLILKKKNVIYRDSFNDMIEDYEKILSDPKYNQNHSYLREDLLLARKLNGIEKKKGINLASFIFREVRAA